MVDSGSLRHATEQGFVAPLGKPLFRPFDEASVHIVAWNGSPDRVDVGGGGIQSFGFLRAGKQMLPANKTGRRRWLLIPSPIVRGR